MTTRFPSFTRIGIALSIAVLTARAGAQTGGDLAPKLDRMKQAAQDDPNLSPELKSAIGDVADALGKQSGASSSAEAWAKAFDKIRFNGDFRLRHESDWHLDDQESRNRERIRLRFGAEYDVNQWIAIGARVVTGAPTDENSPHQNLGVTNDKFPINLDRAYATVKPECMPDTWITAGKFTHPFELNPIYGELVWDQDVSPSGIVAGWKRSGVQGLGDVGAFLGEYIILDNATSGVLESAWMWAAQVYAKQKVNDTNKLTEFISIYRYQELNPDDANGGRLFSENAGNSTIDTTGDGIADDYASRFTIYNPMVALENTGFSQPITVATEMFWNPRARDDAGFGYAVGFKVGKTKAPMDWQVYYQWQVMEQDAVLSNFSNDDFLFGTNYRGHLFGGKLQLLEKTELHLWAKCMRRDDTGTTATTDSDKMQWRARADVNFRF